MPQNPKTVIAKLLVCLLVPGFLVGAGVALADGDDDIVIHERHHIKLKLDEGMDMIEIDDLEIGESRQFFTDGGKEVVVTRTEDGIEVTLDGEEVDMPKIMRFETLHEEIHGDGEHKVIVRTGHGDAHNNVWVTSGEEGKAVVEIENLGDRHEMHWVSSDGADIKIHRRSAAEHLKESGALDDLDESQRQAILDALEDFDSPGQSKVIFIEKDEDGDDD